MNKKGFVFGMMHPGIMFVLGLIIGAVAVYFLVKKGMVTPSLPAFLK